MRVTFLEAGNGLRLTKKYLGNGTVVPYPHVKEVTSHEYQIPSSEQGLLHLERLLRQHSKAGDCMLKGPLKSQIENQSRAGKSDRQAYADLLVLDLDGVRLPECPVRSSHFTAADLQLLAERVISLLPAPMQQTSYIAQASASLGMKGDRISLHLFMMLEVPIPPRTLKLWMQHLNYSVPVFRDQLELSVNGQSLKYPVDPSVADNSKLIFIAPPEFPADQSVQNPFTDDNDRIVLVSRARHAVDLAALMANISPEQTFEEGQALKDKLREDLGVKKKAAKIQTLTVDHERVEVLTNPDRMSITIVDTHGMPFIRCNVNGGDSGAYFFNLRRPTYMYNFKGEPIFEIEKADPDFYLTIFDLFDDELTKHGKAAFPIVLRDFYTDMYYNGLFDPNLNQFSDDYPLTPTSKASITSFMLSHGRPEPDYIPDARVIFDPSSDTPAVDLSTIPYQINMYRRTKYQLNPLNPAMALELGTAIHLKGLTPRIYTLLHHVLGNGDEEFERFINWLAYIYQTRKKAGTAWVFGGTHGTGKGLFYSKVLRPLFGPDHVPMRALQNIEEQFNLYMRNALFLIVDEFHMASTSSGISRIADKLKNQITEETLTIRAMRSNQHEVPNYTNFIFLTNRPDAVKIENGDRRYNIPPRQETKLIDAHPDLVAEIDKIEEELPAFAGVLATFKVDVRLVRTCVDNSAKAHMRSVTMSLFEEFCAALREGNLQFFTELLDIDVGSVANMSEVSTVQRIIKSWVATADDPFAVIPLEHLRMVYHVQTEGAKRMSQPEFGKALARNGIEAQRKRPPKQSREQSAVRGVVVDWQLSEIDARRIIKTYFDASDHRLLAAGQQN